MRAALPLLLPVALLVAGCGPKPQQVGGDRRQSAPPAVVSLSPSTTEIVGSTFDSRQLIGRTAADNFPPSISKTPIVAEVKPDFEKIKSLGPGLILYDGDLYNPADIKKLEAMGIETYAIKAKTVTDFEKEIYELANKLGSETNASGYVDRIERERVAAQGDHITPSPKIAVILGGSTGSLLAAGTGSFVADIVKIVGGTIVGPASDKFAQFSPEALVAAAPDVIVLATDKTKADADFKALSSDPRLRTLPAIQNGKIIPLAQDVVVRRGSRVNDFIQKLNHFLHLKLQK